MGVWMCLRGQRAESQISNVARPWILNLHFVVGLLSYD